MKIERRQRGKVGNYKICSPAPPERRGYYKRRGTIQRGELLVLILLLIYHLVTRLFMIVTVARLFMIVPVAESRTQS